MISERPRFLITEDKRTVLESFPIKDLVVDQVSIIIGCPLEAIYLQVDRMEHENFKFSARWRTHELVSLGSSKQHCLQFQANIDSFLCQTPS